MTDNRPSPLGSIQAMPVLLALFLGLTCWGGWELSIYVLLLIIAHGALRCGATDVEALIIALIVLLLVVLLVTFV